MWAVLVGIISILLFVIYSHVKAKLTPTQEELRAHLIASFGKEGGLVFHSLMVLSGDRQENREELAKEILDEFKTDRQSGVEYSKIFLAKFVQFYRDNPDKLNKNQMRALKMCNEFKIFQKVFINEAS